MTGRAGLVRAAYAAFAADDRAAIESLFDEGFEFFSPPDPGLDRAGFFKRCWPNAGSVASFDFVRLSEVGDEVVVTYEATRRDGSRFRNTELFGFAGDRIARQEVYFGWDLPAG